MKEGNRFTNAVSRVIDRTDRPLSMAYEAVMPTVLADQSRLRRGSTYKPTTGPIAEESIVEVMGGGIAIADWKAGLSLYGIGKSLEYMDLAKQFIERRRARKNSGTVYESSISENSPEE
jgi:hypothetical protein